MRINVANAMGILVVASAPADIIDLAGGAAPLRITPFIVVSLCMVCLSIARLAFRRNAISANGLRTFCKEHLLLAGFVFFMLLSALFAGQDPLSLSLGRTLLTIWIIIVSACLVLRFGSNFFVILISSIKITLVIQFMCDAAQLLIQLGLLHVHVHFLKFVDLTGWTLGARHFGTVLRFNGMVADPNRAAVDIVLMLALAHFGLRCSVGPAYPNLRIGRLYYILAVVLIVLTLSRTGIGALLLFLIGVALENKSSRLRSLAALAFAVPGLMWARLTIRPGMINHVISPLFIRADSASTIVHGDLLGRALVVLGSGIKAVIVGVGWGTSYVYTQSFFGTNRYGNFHSGILSLLVETGVIGGSFAVLYILRPFARNARLWALVAILVWVNVFYQFLQEPLFWITLMALNSKEVLDLATVERARARLKRTRYRSVGERAGCYD